MRRVAGRDCSWGRRARGGCPGACPEPAIGAPIRRCPTLIRANPVPRGAAGSAAQERPANIAKKTRVSVCPFVSVAQFQPGARIFLGVTPCCATTIAACYRGDKLDREGPIPCLFFHPFPDPTRARSISAISSRESRNSIAPTAPLAAHCASRQSPHHVHQTLTRAAVTGADLFHAAPPAPGCGSDDRAWWGNCSVFLRHLAGEHLYSASRR